MWIVKNFTCFFTIPKSLINEKKLSSNITLISCVLRGLIFFGVFGIILWFTFTKRTNNYNCFRIFYLSKQSKIAMETEIQYMRIFKNFMIVINLILVSKIQTQILKCFYGINLKVARNVFPSEEKIRLD